VGITPGILARLARVKTLPVVLAPAGLGAALAAHEGASFSWPWFAVTLLGAGALFAGAMALNDFFDERSGADGLARLERASIVTGSGFIAAKTMTPRAVLGVAASAWTVALATGIAVAAARDARALGFGAAGALLAAGYWAPPVRYGYRGLGLAGIFLAFGPVTVVGSFLVQAERVTPTAWWASVVPGLLAAAVFHHADMLHWRGDKTAKKMTVAARLGIEASVVASGVLLILAFVVLTVEVALGVFPAWALLALIVTPVLAGSWGRAARDPVPQHVLQLLGTSLGAAVLVQVIVAVALALATG